MQGTKLLPLSFPTNALVYMVLHYAEVLLSLQGVALFRHILTSAASPFSSLYVNIRDGYSV